MRHKGETRFKHKLKFHINGLQNELDKVLSVSTMKDESLEYMFITVPLVLLNRALMTCSLSERGITKTTSLGSTTG